MKKTVLSLVAVILLIMVFPLLTYADTKNERSAVCVIRPLKTSCSTKYIFGDQFHVTVRSLKASSSDIQWRVRNPSLGHVRGGSVSPGDTQRVIVNFLPDYFRLELICSGKEKCHGVGALSGELTKPRGN